MRLIDTVIQFTNDKHFYTVDEYIEELQELSRQGYGGLQMWTASHVDGESIPAPGIGILKLKHSDWNDTDVPIPDDHKVVYI